MHATPSPDVVTTLSSLQVEAPKHQTRLKVALLSLPARTQAVLEFFFNSTGRSSFVPTPEEQSEAAIFDIDTVESRQHWQLYQERTGQPGIALSVQPQQLPGTVWVQKPVTPAALLSAAAEIQHQRLQKALAPPAVAAPATVTTAALDAELPHPALASHPAEAARAHLEQALSALPEAAAAASESAALPAAPTPPSPIGTALAEEPTAVSTVGFAPTAPGSLDGLPPAERPLPAASQDRTPVAAPPKPTRVETHTAAAAAAAAALSPQDTRREPTKAKAKGLGGLLRRWFGTDEPASAPASAPVAAPGSPARTPSVSPKPSTPSSDPARSAHAMASESANAGPTSTAAAAQTPVKTAPDTALPIDTVHPAVTASVDTVVQRPTAPPQPASQAPTAETAEHPTATLASAPSDRAQPVTGGVSLGGLSAAAQANDARLCGRMEDRTAQALAEDPEWRFDPEVHLVSVLREAYLVGSKWQGPTHLECSAGRVVVDATRNLLLCDFDIRLLESVITTPLGKRPKTRNLSRQEQAELQHSPPAGAGVQRLDETLWLAGLLTAGGRLPIDTDPNRPVYLRHWPNLTRLSAIPHAVRIAALWSLRGASIVETASTLGIPQRHVIAFYNGALALDLITEDGSHIRRAQRKTGRNRGLLTKLLGWLNR
jgi:hypothetical protein